MIQYKNARVLSKQSLDVLTSVELILIQSIQFKNILKNKYYKTMVTILVFKMMINKCVMIHLSQKARIYVYSYSMFCVYYFVIFRNIPDILD